MRDIKGILPGMFTMGNLACGFSSIILASGAGAGVGANGTRNLFEAVWLIILAAFFDFLDGLVARFSKSYSRFGVELDSLTDIVSFGVAPAVILVSYSLISHGNWAWILGFVYLMAANYRLARFNVSASLEKKVNFVGLPVPAAAIAIISYVLFSYEVWGEIRMERFLVILTLTSTALMVSTVEFETMPRFEFGQLKNRIKVFFILLAAVAIMINASLMIFPFVLVYIMYGVVKLLIMIFAGAKKVAKKKSSGEGLINDRR
jgi:CDP-diacylglycerol--serine O-phosphatidyltransferase